MKTISATVVRDSISPTNVRLTTLEVTYHRFIHGEMMTHRRFSRNSASSRARPVASFLSEILENPALPCAYRYNQPGMQAGELMTTEDMEEAERLILEGRDFICEMVAKLNALGPINPKTGKPLGLHKQWANRYLEPWMWHTVVITSTYWDEFFSQRCSPLAQPELEIVANEMRHALLCSIPTYVPEGGWHTPYIRPDEEDMFIPMKCRVSSGRTCRVSYENQNGVRDVNDDLELFEHLEDPGDGPPHWSPMEHIATPARLSDKVKGNFRGWHQLRHNLELIR